MYRASLTPVSLTSTFLPGVKVAIVKDRLAREGVEMLDLTTEPTPTPTHSSTEQQQRDSEPPCKKRKLGSWLKASKQQEDMTSTQKSSKASVKEEIERYSTITKPDAESHSLDWWKLQAPNYPVLAKLAKKNLCMCASSSPERLLSASDNILSKKCTLLKPEKLNMPVFLAKNL